MTCGIYKLEFGDDYFYIGKSINIEERFQQHCRKLNNGTAAQNMQQAFNTFGTPSQSIIVQCHPDHLDVLEPLFIHANYNSAYCLNGDRPTIHYEKDLIINNEVHSLLQKATLEHINEIIQLRNTEKMIRATYENRLTTLSRLPEIMDAVDLQKELNKFNDEIAYLKARHFTELESLTKQLEKEQKKSWWTKLWE